MAEYRFSIVVHAPIDRVFDMYTDLDRMSEWVGGVTRVTDVTGPDATLEPEGAGSFRGELEAFRRIVERAEGRR